VKRIKSPKRGEKWKGKGKVGAKWGGGDQKTLTGWNQIGVLEKQEGFHVGDCKFFL